MQLKTILLSALLVSGTALQAAVPVVPDTAYRRSDDEKIHGIYTARQGNPMDMLAESGRWIYKHASNDGCYMAFDFDREYEFTKVEVYSSTDGGQYPLRAMKRVSSYSVTDAGTNSMGEITNMPQNEEAQQLTFSGDYLKTDKILFNTEGYADDISFEKYTTALKQVVFYAKGGILHFVGDYEGMPQDQTHYKGYYINVSRQVPTRPGYVLFAWDYDNNPRTSFSCYPGDSFQGRDNNVSLYPWWAKVSAVGDTIVKDSGNGYNLYYVVTRQPQYGENGAVKLVKRPTGAAAPDGTVTVPYSIKDRDWEYNSENFITRSYYYNVETLGADCFSDCPDLEGVQVSPLSGHNDQFALTTMEGSLFRNSPNLTAFTVPRSVTGFTANPFANAPQIRNIEIDAHNSSLIMADSLIYTADGRILVGGYTNLSRIDLLVSTDSIRAYAISGTPSHLISKITVNSGLKVDHRGIIAYVDTIHIKAATEALLVYSDSYNRELGFVRDTHKLLVPCGMKAQYNAWPNSVNWGSADVTEEVSPYQLTIEPAEHGTIEKIADYCDEVTLQAVPDPGYRFVEWTTGEADETIPVELDRDKTVGAVFESITSVAETAACNGVSVSEGRISGPEGMRIYDLGGHDVTAQNGRLHGRCIVTLEKESFIVVVP